MADNPFLEIEQRIMGDIYTSSEPLDNLTILCDDFGSRFAGTPGERLAAEFFVEKFKEYGCQDVRLEPYEYMGWTRGEATLTVLEPIERELPCISLPMCPPAEIVGDFVDARNGSPDDFERLNAALPGAVVMVSSQPPLGLPRTVHRSEKYHRSALGGAGAFIFMNQYPGLGPQTGSIANDREAIIPGISVAKEEGEYLRRLAKRHGHLRLRVKTTDHSVKRDSWNIVADLPGQRRAEQFVILGCHYDGHDISQGAHDPASGTVALLEAARVLARHAASDLGASVRFIEFGTEEIGLIGARRYVEQHEDELDRIRFMLNLDASGGPGRKGLNVNQWTELDSFFERCGQEMKADLPIGQKTSAFSDHFPFFDAGVPTAMMGDPEAVNTGRGFGHSAFDTLDKIELDDLRRASAMAARLALRMSREEPWPLQRRDRASVQALIDAEPNLEQLRLEPLVDALYGRGGAS